MTHGASPQTASEFGPTVWTAVTVRVAWTLMMRGARVTPPVLKDARDHALLTLGAGVAVDEAEHLAGPLTAEYLSRVAGNPIRRIRTETSDLDVVHEGWRRGLAPALDPVADAMLRLHFGDGMAVEAVSTTAAINKEQLDDAKERLRSLVRTMAEGAGVPAQGWPDAKVDQLLTRLANTAEPGCPQPMDVLSDRNRTHVDACPRCSRAVRLIRGGVIAPSDLIPAADSGGAVSTTTAAVILLHPDARRVQKKLTKALGQGAVRVAPDAWLMSSGELGAQGDSIRRLVSDGVVPRHHLRGAVVTGNGRWSGGTLLGPIAVDAIETARSRPWAEVDGMGELPPPRPAPPSPAKWWVTAGAMGVMAVIAGVGVMGPQEALPNVPIQANFIAVEDGWEVTFDADDLAVIDVVSLASGGLTIVHRDIRSARGQWATGDGSYRMYVPDESMAILASEHGLDDLPLLVEQAGSDPIPMQALEAAVRSVHPTVAWVGSPAITVPDIPTGESVSAPTLPEQ